MNRMSALAIALASVLTATAANASPGDDQIQAPRDQEIQAPRSQDEIQAPRGQDEIQAPRDQGVEAPRH